MSRAYNPLGDFYRELEQRQHDEQYPIDLSSLSAFERSFSEYLRNVPPLREPTLEEREILLERIKALNREKQPENPQ